MSKSNSNPERCRKWNITINNPATHGLTHNKIKEILADFENLVYWCMSDEIGLEGGTPHTHLYFHSRNAVRFTTVQRRFLGVAHIEPAYGTAQENKDYVFKEGKWADTEKEDTRIDGTQEEWGRLPNDEPSQSKYYERLFDLITQGKSDSEIIEENPNFIIAMSKFNTIRTAMREVNYKTETRDSLEVHYLYTDKPYQQSRAIQQEYGYQNVYIISDYEDKPFDNYRQEDILILEDFQSNFSIRQMLDYLNIFPVNLPARFNDKTACYTKVYVISHIPLEEQFISIREKSPDLWQDFAERFQTVTVIEQDQTGTKETRQTLEEYLEEVREFEALFSKVPDPHISFESDRQKKRK